MPRKDDDQLGHVPKITPAHDEIASYQRARSKGKLVDSLGEVPDVRQETAGISVATKSVLAAVILLLVATSGLAGYLYYELRLAQHSIDDYELRISALEKRLDVTDTSMSESAGALKVKVHELDSEIRKLWDNVWKRSKQRLEEHDVQLEKQQKQLADVQAFVASAQQQFDKNQKVVADLSVQLKKAEQMRSTVAGNSQLISKQTASVQAAVDKINRLNSDINKLDRRVKGTEEWIDSINGFRRQVNRDLGVLKQAIGQAQGTTAQ